MQCDMCFISMKQSETQAYGGIKELDFGFKKLANSKK